MNSLFFFTQRKYKEKFKQYSNGVTTTSKNLHDICRQLRPPYKVLVPGIPLNSSFPPCENPHDIFCIPLSSGWSSDLWTRHFLSLQNRLTSIVRRLVTAAVERILSVKLDGAHFLFSRSEFVNEQILTTCRSEGNNAVVMLSLEHWHYHYPRLFIFYFNNYLFTNI